MRKLFIWLGHFLFLRLFRCKMCDKVIKASYDFLNNHVSKVHKMSFAQYRTKFEIFKGRSKKIFKRKNGGMVKVFTDRIEEMCLCKCALCEVNSNLCSLLVISNWGSGPWFLPWLMVDILFLLFLLLQRRFISFKLLESSMWRNGSEFSLWFFILVTKKILNKLSLNFLVD